MDIVKKNLVSIICGVVALIAIVLIFFPLGGMFAAIQADVKKSEDVGNKLKTVRSEKRTWPTLSPKPEDAQPLTRFPTEAINKLGTQVTESWKKQTADFLEAAVAAQRNTLKELVPNTLSDKNGPQYRRTAFLEEYTKLMHQGRPAAAGNAGGGGAAALPADEAQRGPPQPMLDTPLVGRMPPLEGEIRERGDAEAERIKRDMTIIVDGQVSNQAAVDQQIADTRNRLGELMRSDVAKNSVVYVQPTVSFQALPNMVGQPSYTDIFNAQVGLWLQQELCRAIYDVNKPAIDAAAAKRPDKKSQGVVDAPIKRLIGIRFTERLYNVPQAAAGTPAPTDVPAVPAIPAAKVASDFTHNPHGQTSNDLYDVLPFRMSLIVEADSLPKTLAGLCAGRYITFRGVDVTAVDAAVAAAQGFIFGPKPLVQVNLEGQYLLMRPFIGPLMPADIVRGLSVPPGGGAAPGGAGGASPGGV